MLESKNRKLIKGFQIQDVDISFRDANSVALTVLDENDEPKILVIDTGALVHASLDDDGAHIMITDNCELFVEPDEAIWLYKEAIVDTVDDVENERILFTKDDLTLLYDWLQSRVEAIYEAEEQYESNELWWKDMIDANRLIDRLVYIGNFPEADDIESIYWIARQCYFQHISVGFKERLRYRTEDEA